MVRKTIILLMAVLFVSMQMSTALKCYSCDTSRGMSCNYGFLSFSYISNDCKIFDTGIPFIDNPVPSNCIKLVGKAKDGHEFVARSCMPATGQINSCGIIAKLIHFVASDELERLNCYICDTDNCNTGSRHSVATLSIVGLTLMSVAFVL